MRLLLVILLILHNLPLKNANSIYDFNQPELKIGKNHNAQIWEEIGSPDPNRTDIRFLFHSSKFGFKNPNFIQNVSDFLLMDNAFSTFNLIADATDDILENSENFSEKPTLWIIDFESKDYAKIFPQFESRQISCDEFDFYGKNRNFQNFDLLLLETYSECGLEIHEKISKNSDFILQSLAQKWKFYDIILMETVETTISLNICFFGKETYVISEWKIPEIIPQSMPLLFSAMHAFGSLLVPGIRFTVFKYRTTQYLPFGLQMWKTFQTFQYFILLNQYPDFYILIWLLATISLQIVSFFLYFLFPPLTWTVPVFDIAPTQAPKDPFSIYSRYMAIGLVLFVFVIQLAS